MSLVMTILGPIVVGVIYISLVSLFEEPNRRKFNAIFVAGAVAAYLSGGFGIWEFAFTAVVTYLAYRGLGSYNFIGVAWLLHDPPPPKELRLLLERVFSGRGLYLYVR